MIVKICGITALDDALAAVDSGASSIGFNFYPQSPRYIDLAQAERIGSRLPAGILKVGIFVNEDPGLRAREAGLDVVQLYGTARAGGYRSWRACRVDQDFGPASLADEEAEAFLLDTPSVALHGGTGETFDWRRASGLGKRIILAGGLDAGNVRQAISAAEPWGVDACSKLESAPGRKDPRLVREFVKAALNL